MRALSIAILAAVLSLGGPAVALAGKSSSGGGGVHTSGGKSYSSGGSHSSGGRSYSSGSTPRPSPTPTPKPSAPRPSSSVRPSGGTYDSAAGQRQRQGESQSAYSRGGWPNQPGIPSGGNSPAGRRYSEGSSAPSPHGRDFALGRHDTFDTGAAAAQRRAESQREFQRGTQPRSTYTDSRGQSRSIDPKDRRVEQVRNEVTPDRWYTRAQRREQEFGRVSPPVNQPVVVYQDPYSNLFWWWLLSQSLDNRAYWAYNHYDSMDRLRYRDLLEHDQALANRVRELEAKQVPRDPSYSPPGIDPDLMYEDHYVEAAVNPQPATPAQTSPASGHHFGRWLLRFMLIGALLGFMVWIVFIKRWGGTE
jgi:hypothetical protein